MNSSQYNRSDGALDLMAVRNIEGWKNIETDSRGITYGDPPKGPRRPVVRFTGDVSRAIHIARRMAKRVGAEIEVIITRDGIDVDAYCTSELVADFSASSPKTEQLPRMLTQCALYLEDLRLCQRATGETKKHQEER